MKKNISSEILSDKWCARCDRKACQYHLVAVKGDTPPIHFCEECYDRLRQPQGGQSCALCGRLAEFGTWRSKTMREYGTVDPVDFARGPDRLVLCRVHHEKFREKIEDRPKQTRLTKFMDTDMPYI